MTTLTELVLDSAQPTANLSLILAVLWIIDNDLAKFTTSSLTMGQYSISRANQLYHNDLINEIFKRSMLTPGIKFFIEGEEVEIVDENLLNNDELNEESMRKYENREKSIWFLDSMTSYRNFENDLLNPNRHYHRNGFFILIYTGTERDRLTNIKEIFRRLFYLYVTNVNVFLIVGKMPYLYTYFPFAKNKCHSSLPEFFISFRGIEKNFENFKVNKQLFPSKVKNMHGCELAVATWHYPPYIYIDYDAKTGDLIRLHGIEGMLISLLSELMNFKIRIKEPVPRDRGDVYPNGTVTGAAKMIVNAEANITIISFMYNKDRSDVMLPSYSYAAIPYVLAIPKGKTMSPFQRLTKPFRYIIWSCFSSSFLFAIICIYCLRLFGQSKLLHFIYGQGNRLPFTNLLSTLFGGPAVSRLPYRTFARYILAVWILYTFVLRSAYSGALFILLQDGRSRTVINSLSQIVERNYTIFAFPAVGRVLDRTVPADRIATISANNPTLDIYKRISTASSNDKIALCTLEHSVKLFNQLNPNARVDVLDQKLITSPVVFYMPLHSYLSLRTQELILRILSAGLMSRFESVYIYSISKTSRENREPIKLTFWLLFGLFSIYIILLLFSFAVFLLEIIEGEANITIISLMYNELRSRVMQPSDSYVTIPYTLAIPQGRKMSPFERLYKPFRYIIWSCFSSTILFAILFIYYLRFLGKSNIMDFVYGQKNRIPITNLLSTLFGGPTLNRIPYKTFARYILVVWMLYTFVLRSAYSAELFKLLQDGRARTSISSLREVIDNNYTIYAFPAVERVVRLAAPDAKTAMIDANNPTSKLFKRISSTTDNEKIALCLLDWSILSYNQENSNERVDILAQPLISAPIVFYMPRHTFLRHQTQQLILRILAAGLIKRFESYYLFATTHSSRVNREPIKLSIWLLFGIFSIYALFLLFCLVIFCLEVASLKSNLCKNVIDFLHI